MPGIEPGFAFGSVALRGVLVFKLWYAWFRILTSQD